MASLGMGVCIHSLVRNTINLTDIKADSKTNVVPG